MKTHAIKSKGEDLPIPTKDSAIKLYHLDKGLDPDPKLFGI